MKAIINIRDAFLCMGLAGLLLLMPWFASLRAQTIFQKGRSSREEAASIRLEEPSGRFDSGTRAIAFAVMEPDTATQSGQIIEVKKKRSLASEIAVFVIVSAFVGYFIAKVFIEGDTETPPPTRKGKPLPTLPNAVLSR
jgi:hypothetical protein